MFYLINVRFYNPCADETVVQDSIVFADSPMTLTKIITDSYSNLYGSNSIEAVTIYPIGEKDSQIIDITDQTALSLYHDWNGDTTSC